MDNITVDNAATDTDDDPLDEVTAGYNGTVDGEGNHSLPDEEAATKTPEKGYVHKPLSIVMKADKEPMTLVGSQPTATTTKSEEEEEVKEPSRNSGKIIKSPLSKKAAESPEALNPVMPKPEKPHSALHHQMITGCGSGDYRTDLATMRDEIIE